MFKKKINLIPLLLSLFFIPSVMAWQTATFSDYTSSKNFTFTGSDNNTFYISLPKNATILGASVNVSGFLYKSGTDGVSISDSTNFIVKYGSVVTTQTNGTHWNTSFILEQKDYSSAHSTALTATLSEGYPKTVQAYNSTGLAVPATINGNVLNWTSESVSLANVTDHSSDDGGVSGTYGCDAYNCANPQSWGDFYADDIYIRWYHGINCGSPQKIYIYYDSFYTAEIDLACTLVGMPDWINTGLSGWPLVYPHHVTTYTISSAGYDVGWDSATTPPTGGHWMIRAEAVNFTRITEYVVYSIWAPNNTYIDTTGNGNRDWSNTGELTSLQTAYLNTTSINNYLSTCTPTNGYCNVPFILHSDNSGIVQVNGISFTNNSISTTISANPNFKFSKYLNDTVYVSVYDAASSSQTCNITANSASYNNVPFGNNATYFAFNWTDGTNTFTTSCCDPLGNCAINSNTTTAYIKKISLINEDNSSAFSNFTQLSTLRAIDEVNSTIFNFLTNNDTWIYVISPNPTQVIRIEKTYVDSFFIDLQTGLMLSDTRICVASSQQFYEIIFYSKSAQPIAVKNTLGNCYVLLSSTRFAYEDALMAKAYTIKANYELYTIDTTTTPPTFNFLTAVDGSLATTHNLDVIELAQSQPEFSLLTDQWAVGFPTNTTLEFYYINQKNDNVLVDVVIRNGTNVFYIYNETTTPNNFTFIWDFTGVSAKLLTVEVFKHFSDGSVQMIERTVNLAAAISIMLDSNLAIIIAVILIFFGMTFVATKYVFGWFGLIILIIAFAITTLAPTTAALRLIQAGIIILCIFVVLIWKSENPTIT